MNYKQALEHIIFDVIANSAKELGMDCYVIGGYVRDLILDRGSHKDIDVVAIGSGIDLANKVAKKYSDEAMAAKIRSKLNDPNNWYFPVPKF